MPATRPTVSAVPADLSHSALKQRHRQVRNAHPPQLTLRIHRALSWLNRAEMADDVDGRFIFLWIAFNAAYAQEVDDTERASDKATFLAFLEKLCGLDAAKRIDDLIWKEFSGSVRALLDNPYVFPQFWEFQRGRTTEAEWRERFTLAKKAAQAALGGSNTPALLSIIFHRLYILRNQLIHGGATWGGKVNRDQLRDSTSLLAKLVPLIIVMMMEHPETIWGDAVYPVVSNEA